MRAQTFSLKPPVGSVTPSRTRTHSGIVIDVSGRVVSRIFIAVT
jgi:hypothetical protein